MGGLEASILKLSECLEENDTQRFDPEYFRKEALEAFNSLKGDTRLSDYVKDGYRVVYENTKVIDREEGMELGLPFFLQAADISTPFINDDRMQCVAESDWDRYPKGRIKQGELLVEVKGRAEKVAVVPKGFPQKTLVTGTCFKLEPHLPEYRSLLLAYLLSKYGNALKDRLKTNLLVAFIAKGDLYRLPVPRISNTLTDRIHDFVEGALNSRTAIIETSRCAEGTLLKALGLADWAPPEPLAYSASSIDAFASGRLDAQYFMPAKTQVQDALRKLPGKSLGERFSSIRQMMDPKKDTAPLIVRNYDVTDALQPILDDEKAPVATEEIGSTKKVFKNGDVAISRLRAYLREIAVVRTDGKIPSVGSSEFIVLRPKTRADSAIAPETLLTFLRSAPVQTILKWCQDGSQHPRFSEGDLLAIHLPDAVEAASTEIAAIVQEGLEARRKARTLLDAAKRAVEIAIEDSEAAALAYLDKMGAA
ncbi:hypothetical protein AB1K42_24775 [Roseibium algicola]|uniref:hypothetical protein n=1 Tax=Roseibium algicola TaxID=2857014 RepID=UPI003459AB43